MCSKRAKIDGHGPEEVLQFQGLGFKWIVVTATPPTLGAYTYPLAGFHRLLTFRVPKPFFHLENWGSELRAPCVQSSKKPRMHSSRM